MGKSSYLCSVIKKEIVKQLKHTAMKTMNFNSEADTEKKVLELTSKGANFRVIGRKTIVIL
jgi:hypothetical protein